MGHGNLFLQYLYDQKPRGFEEWGSINWLMGMDGRPARGGWFGVETMISLEPATIGGCGYPDLLATGELCDGQAIVDEQHPHDLFMQLSARYERPLTSAVAWQVYGGPVGEPALGPVAFPHRISSLPNPIAPIAHHWLDATHITFGVVTGALYGRRWKVEASAFNGREPDEDRLGFDLAALDSFSGRLTILPTASLAVQVSGGHLEDAEPGHGDEAAVDVRRLTASLTYHRMNPTSIWASTVAWGRNTEQGECTSFLLAETSLLTGDRHSWFGRVEVGRKPAHDLGVHDVESPLEIGKAQGGYVRYAALGRSLRLGLGGSVAASFVPPEIESEYGGRARLGAAVFLTLRPAATGMTPADPHAGHQVP
jgi:hypothetical protein